MSAEWEPPSDPGEFAAWLDNFADKLPQYADKLGISPAELAQVQAAREFTRQELFAATQQALSGLATRLQAVCPAERWPGVFKEAFARLPVTREPDRSQMLRLLENWIAGVERAHGADVRPVLTWNYFEQGIDLTATIPKPCEMSGIYYRIKGRAKWEFLIRNTGTRKRIYTTAENLDEPERTLWPGRTLEFVAGGWFEEAAFGFPTEPVAVPVPVLAA